jgi:anti-anti-sigma factor
MFHDSDRPVLTVRRATSAAARTVIVVAGEVDSDNCDDLTRGFEQLLPRDPADRAGRIALDLGELTFMGSAGLRALMKCRDIAEQQGSRLEISEAHQNVHSVLAVSGLIDVFRPPPDAATGTAADLAGVGRRAHQRVIDAEVRASRRAILDLFRKRLWADPGVLGAADFLMLADRRVLLSALLIATSRVADVCCLHAYDPRTEALRLVHGAGLPAGLLRPGRGLHAVGTAVAEAGHPVLIEDVRASPLFAHVHPAWIRATQAYPLWDDRQDLLGVLSLCHRAAGRHPGQEQLALAAARAIADIGMPDYAEARDAPPADGALNGTAPAGSGPAGNAPAGSAPAGNAPAGGAPALAVALRADDGMTTIGLRGALDAGTAPAFARRAQDTAAVLRAGQRLVIDLREVNVLAASGARALRDVAALCLSRKVDCHLIAGPGDDARAVLDRLNFVPPLRIVAEPGHLPARRP